MELQEKDILRWCTEWRFPVNSPGPFSCLWDPSSVLVYTSAKGVELCFVLQVNFKAQSVFRKCFKTLGEMTMLRPFWILISVQVLLEDEGHLAGWNSGGFQSTQACCLEYKCEWWTDCLLPNWNCSVGIYWHGIIPRWLKKKKREKLDCTFF